MNFRSQARAFLMQAATLARADELALSMQKHKGRSCGLVVGVHETPVSLEAQFREQLEWVSEHFTISSLEGFATLWEKHPESGASSKPLLLFTFDDGRESNYTVAAPLLESFGGRGVFFVVPSFAECAADDALAFYRARINPNSRPGDENWEDWKPMNPGQIVELASRGHAIGNHTLTHQRLVGLAPDRLEREIGDSARKLASWTKQPVEAFAWTFGWDAVDANAWEVIQRHHRFCFAPCPGAIDTRQDSPSLLWRREIEVKYSAPEYRFLYSGLVDPWWSTRRRRLRKMLRVSLASNSEYDRRQGRGQNER
jgi:peptidoglycan/xylan/chitin deacetylase (PgdA/CDA1 family)